MKTTQRVRRLSLTEFLTFGLNAKIRIRDGNDYKFITATELGKLDVKTSHLELTTTKTVTAAETGMHFVLNTATAFVTTLPALAVGLEYFFHIGATAPTTTHTIVTNGSANVIEGNIASSEDGTVAVAAASDTVSFVASKALRGDYAHVYCDGVNWFLDGMCKVQDGMTATQAS
jgi:hypothetical protein